MDASALIVNDDDDVSNMAIISEYEIIKEQNQKLLNALEESNVQLLTLKKCTYDNLQNIENQIKKFHAQQDKLVQEGNELQNKLEHLIAQNEFVQSEIDNLEKSNEHLQKKCNKYKVIEINDEDKKKLHDAFEIYKLSSEISGITFVLTSSQKDIKGYIINKHGKKRPFHFSTEEERNKDLLVDKLWNLIKEERL